MTIILTLVCIVSVGVWFIGWCCLVVGANAGRNSEKAIEKLGQEQNG